MVFMTFCGGVVLGTIFGIILAGLIATGDDKNE
jgi:hypothetical protein